MIIFFDIDDTLISSTTAHKTALGKLCSEFSLEIDNDVAFLRWMEISDKYLKLYFQKKLSVSQFRFYRIKDFWKYTGNLITDKQVQLALKRYHDLFLQHCIPFPETIPTLEKLKNYKLGIITNAPVSDQIRKLKNNKLIHYFNTIVISEEVGVSKPQKEIFELATKQANDTLSDCVYIGDSLENDYLGSINAGMKAIWLNRQQNTPNFEGEQICSLDKLITHKYLTP